jgi:hypothetical protein
LLRRTITIEDPRDQVVHRDDGGRGAVPCGDLLASDRERAVAEAGAAPFLANGDTIEAHRRQALQRLAREFLVAVPARGIRRELLAREAAHGLANFTVVGHR